MLRLVEFFFDTRCLHITFCFTQLLNLCLEYKFYFLIYTYTTKLITNPFLPNILLLCAMYFQNIFLFSRLELKIETATGERICLES